MKWFNVKVKFPKHVYQELKLEALNRRISFSALVREKAAKKKHENDG